MFTRSLKEVYFWLCIVLTILFIILLFVLKGNTINLNAYQWLAALIVTGILNIVLTSIANSKDKLRYRLEIKEKRYLKDYDLKEKRCQKKMDHIEIFITKLNSYKKDFSYFEHCTTSKRFFELQGLTFLLIEKTEEVLNQYNLEIAFDDNFQNNFSEAYDLYHSTIVKDFLNNYKTEDQIQKVYDKTLKRSSQLMINIFRGCVKQSIEKYHEIENKSIE